MSHLLRSHAPITEKGWALIDDEARSRVSVGLAARRLVDFSGPHGWEHSASNLGRVDPLSGDPAGRVKALQRKVLPLVEFRGDFTVSRAELADAERGAEDLDLADLDTAAVTMSIAENVAVFHGYAAGGIVGVTEATPHPTIMLGDDCEAYPRHVATAVQTLMAAGVGGPYGLALGPGPYTGVIETAEHGGQLLLEHLRQILGGPVVWAPGVKGAVVISQRGGDFLFDCGQDLAVGYDHHDAEKVALYVEESFSFWVATPEAAIALT
ncbi:MAG: family 1 encapsulin nanocompartment shell protein [Actinomycetota bacterium]